MGGKNTPESRPLVGLNAYSALPFTYEEKADTTNPLEILVDRIDNIPSHYDTQKFLKYRGKIPSDARSELESLLASNEEHARSLSEMENTNGKPNLLRVTLRAYIIADLSKESPRGRNSEEYLDALKSSEAMRIAIMRQTIYTVLNRIGDFNKQSVDWAHSDIPVLVGHGPKKGFKGWRGVLVIPRKKETTQKLIALVRAKR